MLVLLTGPQAAQQLPGVAVVRLRWVSLHHGLMFGGLRDHSPVPLTNNGPLLSINVGPRTAHEVSEATAAAVGWLLLHDIIFDIFHLNDAFSFHWTLHLV